MLTTQNQKDHHLLAKNMAGHKQSKCMVIISSKSVFKVKKMPLDHLQTMI